MEQVDLKESREKWIQLIEGQERIGDRYAEITRLGKDAGDGQFSLVFSANDLTTQRKVAIKFFDPTPPTSTPYRLECFDREVRNLERFIGKPNIIQLIEGKRIFNVTLSAEGNLSIPYPLSYFVVEWARSDLRGIIYTQNTSAINLLRFFKEASKAVQRMHMGNMCHRDLKPSNFLIVGKQELKLGDFGTSKVDEDSLRSEYDWPSGDFRYTSLELLCGMYDERQFLYSNDFYALGALLFEMFTKTTYSLTIYDDITEMKDLCIHFAQTDPKERKAIFHKFVLSRDIDVPNIFSFNDDVPKSIQNNLNRLYKSLVHPDYRKRSCDFSSIFRQLDIIRIILANEKKYRKWKKMKDLRRSNHLSKEGRSG